MLHPRQSILNRFADGELSGRTRARAAGHLAKCATCRNTVAAIRGLGRDASALPSPTAPSDLKDRIVARLQAGEQVILPVADPLVRRYRVRKVSAAVAGAAAVAVTVFLLAPPIASETSELRFFPDTPARGEDITVEYQRTSAFAGEERLVLRARYRTTNDRRSSRNLRQVVAGYLYADDHGLYRGVIQLPQDVVYAVFAVEDEEGRRVDSNGRALWELMVHDNGVPAYEALVQKQYDLLGRNWELAFETARLAARMHPDEPGAWFLLSSLERELGGVAQFDSARHRAAFARLERVLKVRTPTADDVAGMFMYAVVLGDTVAAAPWRARLMTEAPQHDLAVQMRRVEIVERADLHNPVLTVAALDRLWANGGAEDAQLPRIGFFFALQTGDATAIARWADRYELLGPRQRRQVAEDIVTVPALREMGIKRLRDQLDRGVNPRTSDRALVFTVGEQRRRDEAARRSMAALLGRVLIEGGDTAEGVSYLDVAVRDGWDVDLFLAVAEIKLSLADSAAAFGLWARAAVTPSTNHPLADPLARLAQAAIGEGAWNRLLLEARTTLVDRILPTSSVTQSVPGDLVWHVPTGLTRSLDDVTQGRVTLVAFWSRHSPPALREAAQLQAVTDRILELDGRVAVVMAEPWSDELDRFLGERDLTFPVYADAPRDAFRAFNAWGTSDYFVLDGSGRVRFSHSELDDVLTQVLVLQHDATPPVASLADQSQ